MKSLIALFLLVSSMFFVSCGKSSKKTISNQEAQAEFNLVRSKWYAQYNVGGTVYEEYLEFAESTAVRQIDRGAPHYDSVTFYYNYEHLDKNTIYIVDVDDSSDEDTIEYEIIQGDSETRMNFCSVPDDYCTDYLNIPNVL